MKRNLEKKNNRYRLIYFDNTRAVYTYTYGFLSVIYTQIIRDLVFFSSTSKSREYTKFNRLVRVKISTGGGGPESRGPSPRKHATA